MSTTKDKDKKPAVSQDGNLENQGQDNLEQSIREIDSKIETTLADLKEVCGTVYPLFLGDADIDNEVVNDVFDDLCAEFPDGNDKLCVIIDSSGGDIDAAYNLALLLRQYATKELNFYVPRWAKSAATLVVCSGEKIYMGPIAELGPVDPQITQINPMERRMEQFSPLHIGATLELIRNEFKDGNEKLAKGLLERLQFPLTLGVFTKSLEIGKQYLVKLLTTRMFAGQPDAQSRAEQIAKKLVEDYAGHGFCIDQTEAKAIGLTIEPLSPECSKPLWQLYKLRKEKDELEELKRKTEDAAKMKANKSGKFQKPALIQKNPEPIVKAGAKQMTLLQSNKDVSNQEALKSAEDFVIRLLKQKGEIAISEVRTNPFLNDPRQAESIIASLAWDDAIEFYQRKVEAKPILRWEKFIRLKARK